MSFADWRSQVEKELAGAPFEKLITNADGVAVQPLYTERVDSGEPGAAPYTRGAKPEATPFDICMRIAAPGPSAGGAGGSSSAHAMGAARAGGRTAILEEELAGGADSLWVAESDRMAIEGALDKNLGLIVDVVGSPRIEHFKAVMKARRAWLGFDPIDEVWRGELDASNLPRRLNELGAFASRLEQQRGPTGTLGAQGHDVRSIRVSSLAFVAAGADAADELALVLASGVTYLRALAREGLDVATAARSMWVQLSVGRDTFGELCKLRAMRLLWWKLLAATGVGDVPLDSLHAVCSSRTQSLRDPWVNMLRVTTEVFAAVLGGAQVVTPIAFDDAFGAASSLGRRTARNTALVLREESHLGRVLDAGGGSYYLESRTDALAREAWNRFSLFERAGGLVSQLPAIKARLEEAWQVRAAAIARRKEPVLGVSEFANVDEKLPAPVPKLAVPGHRDGEAFEALRARVEGKFDVSIVLVGPASEFRARLGYAQAFFATAGLRTSETSEPAATSIACLCGSDERYATDAVAAVKKLKDAGVSRIVLAGRPGALEKALREAGVESFIYVGCDVIATLATITGAA